MKRISLAVSLCAMALFLSGVLSGCGSSRKLSIMPSHDLFRLGKENYDNKKYLKAIEAFQAVVYNYPGESIVDSAQYYLGLSYFGNKDYELAQVEFNRLVLNYPSSVYFQHALFMRAVCFFEGTPKHYALDQSDLARAIQQFEDYIIDYPDSELRSDAEKYLAIARGRIARKYFESANVYRIIRAYEAAQIYYQKVVDEYTSSEYGQPSTFYVGEMMYNRRKYEDAVKQLKNFVLVFPQSDFVEKANKLIADASFKSGEQAFNSGKYQEAKEKLDAYLSGFPNHGNSNKAKKLLEEIDLQSVTKINNEKGNS